MSRLSLKLLDNWASVAVLVLLLFLPVYGQVMTYAEGAVFPVTSKIELLDVSPSEGGTQLRFRYAKLRPCELVGTSWSVKGNLVDFHVVGGAAATRSPGYQTSRIWYVDAPDITGSEVTFFHRCNALWLTATKVYP